MNIVNGLPASNTDTSVIMIMQTRTATTAGNSQCNADNPAPTCIGSSVETRTITNPLSSAADTATWGMWTPTNNVNTSVIDIIQTRECVVTVVGTADNQRQAVMITATLVKRKLLSIH